MSPGQELDSKVRGGGLELGRLDAVAAQGVELDAPGVGVGLEAHEHASRGQPAVRPASVLQRRERVGRRAGARVVPVAGAGCRGRGDGVNGRIEVGASHAAAVVA